MQRRNKKTGGVIVILVIIAVSVAAVIFNLNRQGEPLSEPSTTAAIPTAYYTPDPTLTRMPNETAPPNADPMTSDQYLNAYSPYDRCADLPQKPLTPNSTPINTLDPEYMTIYGPPGLSNDATQKLCAFGAAYLDKFNKVTWEDSTGTAFLDRTKDMMTPAFFQKNEASFAQFNNGRQWQQIKDTQGTRYMNIFKIDYVSLENWPKRFILRVNYNIVETTPTTREESRPRTDLLYLENVGDGDWKVDGWGDDGPMRPWG